MFPRVAIGFLVLGVAWRLLRYGLWFPLWGDEAAIALNLMDARGWADALRPGREQVSPFLFLWAEKVALLVFGPSELGLRLLPVAAGILALVLFWRLARLALEPLSAALAVGILSVSYFPVRFTCEVKSYSLDLAVSAVLLLLALSFLSGSGRLLPLVLLTCVAPLGVGLSYPAALVVAAVSCALLPAVLRHPDRSARLLFVGYNLAAAATFACGVIVAGIGQFEGQGGFRNLFWQGSFPPFQPIRLLVWLVTIHSGNLFAYPLGDVDGMNTLTFLLSLAGIVVLRKTSRRGLLALLLLPFGWTLLAAALRLYPYGGHPRIAQHLAPGICLLAGAGLAALLRFRAPAEDRIRRRVRIVSGVLGFFAVTGMVLDAMTPYKSGGDVVFRRFVAAIASEAGPEDLVVFCQSEGSEAPWPLEFYVRRAGLHASWDCRLDRGDGRSRQVWVISYRLSAPAESMRQELLKADPPYALAEDRLYALSKGADRDPPVPCSVSRWRRPAG